MTTAPAPPSTRQDAEHPAPHRGQAAPWSLWTGLMLAPGAWFLQLSIEMPLLSQACYPHDVPLGGGLPALMPIVLALDAAALVAAAVGFLLARGNWRRTAAEKAGSGHRLLASGDGRTRFMAMAGMLTSGLLAVAILYIGAFHAMLPECGL